MEVTEFTFIRTWLGNPCHRVPRLKVLRDLILVLGVVIGIGLECRLAGQGLAGHCILADGRLVRLVACPLLLGGGLLNLAGSLLVAVTRGSTVCHMG